MVSFTSGSWSLSAALLSEIFFFRTVKLLADVTDEKTPLTGIGDWSPSFIIRTAQTRKRTSEEAGIELYSNFVFGP